MSKFISLSRAGSLAACIAIFGGSMAPTVAMANGSTSTAILVGAIVGTLITSIITATAEIASTSATPRRNRIISAKTRRTSGRIKATSTTIRRSSITTTAPRTIRARKIS
jgi:hypothetical protein